MIRDREPLRKDLENLTAASQGSDATEFFMNAASPGVISVFQNNEYYPDDDAYLGALANVMREEYEAIANAGFVLQIDCPDLAMGRHTEYRELSEADFLKHAAMQIEALNAALVNIPADRVRMHICWGNYEGPHHLDIPFETIFDVVMKAKPQGLLVEAANPRHSHEWRVFESKKLPDDKIIIPGVIDSVSNYIEHPDVVADRICSYCQHGGPGTGHRRRRLWFRHLCRNRQGRPGHRVRKIQVTGGRGGDRLEAVLELRATPQPPAAAVPRVPGQAR